MLIIVECKAEKTVIEHFAEVKLTVSELQRTVGGSSSFKHTQIMTALTPMNAIIAASGGQDTNVISSQKATRQVFFVVWLFLFDFRRRSYCFRFVYENNAGGLL